MTTPAGYVEPGACPWRRRCARCSAAIAHRIESTSTRSRRAERREVSLGPTRLASIARVDLRPRSGHRGCVTGPSTDGVEPSPQHASTAIRSAEAWRRARCGDGVAAQSRRAATASPSSDPRMSLELERERAREAVHVARRRRLPALALQHEVWDAGRFVGEVDAAYPELKLAIEVDGFEHHSTPEAFQRDRTRQNGLVALGWTVLRFTWHDVVQRPAHVAQLIRPGDRARSPPRDPTSVRAISCA